MDNIIEIILQAVDNASDVFSGVGESASQMGTDLQASIEEANAEVERLTQELADIEMGNIEGDFDAVSAQLVQAQQEADALEQEFNEADQAAQDMGNDLGIINSSMLLQLGEQVGQLGSQAEGMAQDMNTAAISVGQLATQAGVAEPQMIALINNISNATFPNDEAMMYVKSLDQIGVSSENLGKSATDLDRINDAFGLGAETTNSLGQELSVLGVDMNNVSSSFNALAYANANTVGGMNNYYNFLRKYDAQFKELGLNVDQASVIIAAATQKFGGGRAALSGLNSALEESNGDTRALEQSLGLAAGSLDNASQITGQYEGQLQQLANEEAEHKTLLDQIGAAWEDVSLSISQVASPLMGVVGLFGQVGQFGLQVSGLKELLNTFKGLKTAMMEYEAIQKLASIATAAYGTIVAIVTGEIGLAEAATMAWNAVLAMNPVVWVIAALIALVAIIYEVGKAFGWWQDVGGMIDAIWSGIQRLWEAFINHPDVQAAIEVISGALQVLWSWISQAWEALMNFFGIATGGDFDVVAALINGIGAAWNAVTYPLRVVIGAVQQIINVFNQFRSGQMDLPAFIMNILQILANTYMQIFGRITQMVVQFGSRLLSNGINAASRFVSGIVTRLMQLPGKVYSALAAVVGKIRSAIQAWISAAVQKVNDLISKITGPFQGVAGSISSALGGVANALLSPFKTAWQWIEPYYNKIKGALDWVGSALPRGGEAAMGGEPLIGSNTSYSTGSQSVDVNHNITLDLVNVPAQIDTQTLIGMLRDPTVLRALTSSPDFQSLDAKVKERLNLKQIRARGR